MFLYDSFSNYVKTITDKDLASWLPFPAYDSNKYSRGKVMVGAGSPSYPGAAVMCAKATQLSGAGYTEVFTAKRNVPLIQTARPSLVVRSFKQLNSCANPGRGCTGAFVFGPGIEASDLTAKTVLLGLIKGCSCPLLIDGGGFDHLPKEEFHQAVVERGRAGHVTVLTPHPGEAARLGIPFGIEPHDDFERTALELSECYKAIVVLKGPDTTIASKGTFVTVEEGTSALAKAGTGDVLAGFIGGFLAQGVDPFYACLLGVVLHARAGIIAAQSMGPICVCADDLLDMFPTSVMDLAAELDD
ncbi:MAG: NAD(P)H-hydrate dehydratase [Coriobacteriia bacterium]|nr:NAD(P)H-hydrate dehydratase [Coriobacteriia bacterium]